MRYAEKYRIEIEEFVEVCHRLSENMFVTSHGGNLAWKLEDGGSYGPAAPPARPPRHGSRRTSPPLPLLAEERQGQETGIAEVILGPFGPQERFASRSTQSTKKLIA